jgi:hypothetical protein
MIARMRELVPDITLRTTFITGHPGETPKDFGELCDFVEWAQFDNMGAFVYSQEESTIAARMLDVPTRKTAERRRTKLMELQQKIALSRNEMRVGRTFEALVTGVCEETEHLLEGRIIGQAAEIDGRLLINDGIDLLPKNLPAFARIEITDAHPSRRRPHEPRPSSLARPPALHRPRGRQKADAGRGVAVVARPNGETCGFIWVFTTRFGRVLGGRASSFIARRRRQNYRREQAEALAYTFVFHSSRRRSKVFMLRSDLRITHSESTCG